MKTIYEEAIYQIRPTAWERGYGEGFDHAARLTQASRQEAA